MVKCGNKFMKISLNVQQKMHKNQKCLTRNILETEYMNTKLIYKIKRNLPQMKYYENKYTIKSTGRFETTSFNLALKKAILLYTFTYHLYTYVCYKI